jgi:phospholipase D1/2
MDHFLDHAKGRFNSMAEDAKHFAKKVEDKFDAERHSHTHKGFLCHALHNTVHNRFHSFAPPRIQNGAKWYIDGCSYFWALSEAIESAKDSIWIMDWWLSPELFLRRPPSKWPNYRLDYMLKAAAQRGVKINVMVYKEVENVLTCESFALHATLYAILHLRSYLCFTIKQN